MTIGIQKYGQFKTNPDAPEEFVLLRILQTSAALKLSLRVRYLFLGTTGKHSKLQLIILRVN